MATTKTESCAIGFRVSQELKIKIEKAFIYSSDTTKQELLSNAIEKHCDAIIKKKEGK
jgi:hypothetical protein